MSRNLLKITKSQMISGFESTASFYYVQMNAVTDLYSSQKVFKLIGNVKQSCSRVFDSRL